MHYIAKNITRNARTLAAVLTVVGTAGVGMSVSRADETQAKNLFKAMSDYLAAQKVISMDIDSNLEVVTQDGQKLSLASSGTVILNRPDKIQATRKGGFADVAMVFDGKTATLLRKDTNTYAQVEVPGTIDHFVDELRDKYQRPLPAADLLMANPYHELMPLVVSTKDLGSGVIGGVECDHLAFKTEEVDWQIWIAQGERPYPCRYVITSNKVAGSPQYTIDVRAWKTGAEVAADSFSLQIPTGAKKINLSDLPDFDELPSIFAAKR
jgi:hypothetical protein